MSGHSIYLSISLMASVLLASPTAFAEVVTVEGTVKSVDAKKRTISIETGGKTKDFDVSSKAKIHVDGKDTSLDSLKAGQQVKLSYHDELDVVLKIESLLRERETRQNGEIALFDGMSLNGWQGSQDAWNVNDGVIVGEQPGGKGERNLFHISTFKNFRVKAKFQVLEGNSGIFFRAENGKDGKCLGGYQLDLRQPKSDRNGTIEVEPLLGPISPSDKTKTQINASLVKGEWNEVEIVANGDSISTTINGIKAVEFHDARYSKGVIGLQLSNQAKARFKSILVEPLP